MDQFFLKGGGGGDAGRPSRMLGYVRQGPGGGPLGRSFFWLIVNGWFPCFSQQGKPTGTKAHLPLSPRPPPLVCKVIMSARGPATGLWDAADPMVQLSAALPPTLVPGLRPAPHSLPIRTRTLTQLNPALGHVPWHWTSTVRSEGSTDHTNVFGLLF